MPTKSNAIIDVLVKIIVAITLSMSSFCLAWMFNANTELKTMSLNIQTMQESIKALSTNKDSDIKQDKMLAKHWKLHTWTKDRLNEIRNKEGLPLASWPDFQD